MSDCGGALALLASLVLEDGRRWAEAATPAQWADGRAVLDSAGAPMAFLTRPRGGAKTSDLAAVVVARLLTTARSGDRAYGAGADRDQAALLVDAIRGYVARTPGLVGSLTVDAWKVTATATGATFAALAADGPSTFGLRPALVVVDELAVWPETPGARQVWTALVSAMAKVPGAKLVVLTSAGSPAHWSHKVLLRARESPQWHVSEWPGPVPWVDPSALEEQRHLLTESMFARLHLNRWTEAEDSLTSRSDVLACATLDGPQDHDHHRGRYVLSADLGLKSDRTVIVVAHGEQGPDRATTVVVDRKLIWHPTRGNPVQLREVEAALEQAAASYGGPTVVLDPWQAVGIAQRLRAKGLRVVEFAFTASSAARLAQTLYSLLREHRLAFDRTDEELLEELQSVRLTEGTPGTVRFDPKAPGHDDQAVAVALAAYQLLEHPVSSYPAGWGAELLGRARNPEPTLYEVQW